MSKLTLVNKDALYRALPYPDDAIEAEFYGKVLDAIDNLPIAYDPDKVIEQLKEVSFVDIDEEYADDGQRMLFLHDAIEIVKGGAE